MSDKKTPTVSKTSNLVDFSAIDEANKTMSENLNYILRVIEQKVAKIPDGDPVKNQLNKFVENAKK
jgi:hypothetical protein